MDTSTINSGVTDVTPQNQTLSRQVFPSALNSLRMTRENGFTLIELIVVMSLIGIMLGFAAPQLRTALFVDGTKKVSRWLMITIPATKTKAFREQKLMALGVSLDQDKVWVMDQQPSEEDEGNADEETDEEDEEDEEEDEDDLDEVPEKPIALEFPDDVHIMDVEYPEQDRISVGETEIYFYPKGHSDHAIIHVEDNDGNRYSFLIEPFLPNVKRIDDYVSF